MVGGTNWMNSDILRIKTENSAGVSFLYDRNILKLEGKGRNTS